MGVIGRSVQKLTGLLLLAAGCATTPPMATFLTRLPEEQSLVAVDRTMASGLLIDEDFRLGDYAIADVSRGWVSSGAAGMGGSYRFVTRGAEGAWSARCDFERRADASVWSAFAVDCACTPIGGGAAARVRAETLDGRGYQGSMALGGESYPVRSHGERPLVGTLVNPVFTVGEPRIMAIDVGDTGEVWLGPAAQAQRQGAVCLAAGLMLFRPTHALPPQRAPAPPPVRY